jgi:hypothetical protein
MAFWMHKDFKLVLAWHVLITILSSLIVLDGSFDSFLPTKIEIYI